MMKADDVARQKPEAPYSSELDFEDSHLLHFIWSGGAIRASALENILAWGKIASTAGWKVYLWTDAVNKSWSSWVRAQLYFKGVELKDIDATQVDARFWQTYQALVRGQGAKNYPAASDLARYSILQKHGGIYLDVDIAPGKFTLPTARRFRQTDLPLLAPQLRDMESVRLALGLKRTAKVTPEDVKVAARNQLSKGVYNNNFIVSHKNSEAMEAVILCVLKYLKSRGGAATLLDLQDTAALTTGPGPVTEGLLDYVSAKRGVSMSEAKSLLTIALFHDFELEWLTAESENQEH